MMEKESDPIGRDSISTTVAERSLDVDMDGRVVNGNSYLLRDVPVTLVSPHPAQMS